MAAGTQGRGSDEARRAFGEERELVRAAVISSG